MLSSNGTVAQVPASSSKERTSLRPGADSRSQWSTAWRQGLPAIWSSGLMILTVLLLLLGMIWLIVSRGLGHFWPATIVQVETESGTYAGSVRMRESMDAESTVAVEMGRERLQLHIGNRDLYGLDFRWFDPEDILATETPARVTVVERQEHGNFHGYLTEIRTSDGVVRGEEAWEALSQAVDHSQDLYRSLHDADERYEKVREPLTRVEQEIDNMIKKRRAGSIDESRLEELQALQPQLEAELQRELGRIAAGRDAINLQMSERVAVLQAPGGREKPALLHEIVRAYRPNAMTLAQKSTLYVSKLWEFVSGQPRESNTEGGIFPALFGTVLMVLLMTIAVVPMGVIAALYLHEYAREGFILRAVRLAVNNMAGLPSIVFGMFGLAFFVYGVGGFIDRSFYADQLPNPTYGTGGILWASLTLALLTLPVVVVATEEGLSAVPKANREGSLALGATKWQTLWHVVLPQATPGILTGVILAIGRAAGEVAPLMLTGVVKLAPALALDAEFPFLHLERKFMHLGFHVFDVSMQSPNVEAAKPMVYTTTLLLLVLVVALNTTAIVVRQKMRRRYQGAVV